MNPTKSRAFRFETQQWLPAPLEKVFPFFADAMNLQRLTPWWLKFHVLTPAPIEMRVGALIDYKLRVRGIPLRWQSEITAWQPPYRFVDEQRRGPYRMWVHEHTFESKDGGTLVRDRVDYAVPGGRIINALLVRPDLNRIFQFRAQTLAEIFAAAPQGEAKPAHLPV